MAYSNGKIFDDVSIEDVNAVLNTSYSSWDECCTSPALNKWSTFKPLAHTILFGDGFESALTEVQAKGAEELITDGVIYGLRVGQGVNGWQNLHNCDYAFVGRPNGSPYPHRSMDFIGYDHNAQPTLRGSIVSTEINYNAINIKVGLLWAKSTNTTGIDILKLIGRDGNLNNYYVNVLIDNYSITLLNQDTGTRTTVAPNGVKQNTFYINSLPSGYSTTRTAKCTFFLSPTKFESWTNVASATQADVAVTIPDVAGLTISIASSAINYGTWTISSISALSNQINASMTCSVAPGADRTYRAVIQFSGQAQGAVKTFSVSANASASMASQFVRWTAGELGFTVISSGDYSCTVTLYGYDSTTGTSTQLAQKTQTVSLTAQ